MRIVSTGWAMINQRKRELLIVITPHATMSDQPTCSDGIAANWLANDWTACELYGFGPYSTIVSTKPGIMRGGASGNTTWIASAPSVTDDEHRADLAVLAAATARTPRPGTRRCR